MAGPSQPLATLAGVRVLMDGANAIEPRWPRRRCWGGVIVRPTYEKQNCLFYPFRFAFECREFRAVYRTCGWKAGSWLGKTYCVRLCTLAWHEILSAPTIESFPLSPESHRPSPYFSCSLF